MQLRDTVTERVGGKSDLPNTMVALEKKNVQITSVSHCNNKRRDEYVDHLSGENRAIFLGGDLLMNRTNFTMLED